MTNLLSDAITAVKNWWLFLLTGVLLVIGAIWVFFTPVESYLTLAWLFIVLVFANGISYVIFSIANYKELKGWGWYLVGGIFEIIIGIGLLYYPEVSITMLPIFVGFWFLFRGAQIIASSLEMRDYGFLDWGWLMLFGIALSVMAFFMIVYPVFGAFNVVYLTGIALLFFGFAHIMVSLQLRRIKKKTIDRVDELKKSVKKDLNDLKKDIINNLKEVSEEEKKKIDENFEDYESNLDLHKTI